MVINISNGIFREEIERKMTQRVALQKETFDSLRMKQFDVKREIILQSAERVFARIPFKKVSMRQIAREAGISHATIYRYFPDQQALFVEAFLRGAKEIAAELKAIIEKGGDQVTQEVAEAFVTFLFDHDHYFKMMSNFMLEGEVAPPLFERIDVIARSLIDQFERALKAGGKRRPSRLLTHSFFSALNGILITFHDYPGKEREEIRQHVRRLARLTARVFIHGEALMGEEV